MREEREFQSAAAGRNPELLMCDHFSSEREGLPSFQFYFSSFDFILSLSNQI